MIALDTNVLARYLLNDDPKQASAAALHLALSLKDASFCTFDKALVNQASRTASGLKIATP